mmetsp:Transcript_42407/g.102529  ORF Transcript_42407/g.102529 Transcript_42407/m.102529 type:complete len:92 (+) Transcript_42407:1081-1356(+)
MVVKSHVGDLIEEIPASQVEPFLYEFEFSQMNRGIGVLEIFINGEQIPESPIQVEVVNRDCEAAYLYKRSSTLVTGCSRRMCLSLWYCGDR